MNKFERIGNMICDLFGVTSTEDQARESSLPDAKDTEI